MNRSRQNLRKSERIIQLGLCLVKQKSYSQNMRTQTTERLQKLKQKIPKINKPQEIREETKQNEKDISETMKGINNKVQKLRYSKKLTIDEVYLNNRNRHQQELKNKQKKKIMKRLQEDQCEKKDEQQIRNEQKEQNQNQEQQSLILDMVALQARSELRNELEWKNHEYWNQIDYGNNNNLFKMQHEESFEQDSIFCYSFFSNDNYKLENYVRQKKKISDKNQKLISKIEKLEEQYSQNYDSNKVKIEDNNQIQKENDTTQRNQQNILNITDKQQKLEDNQRGISRLIKISKREDEYSPLKQDEESQETNNFSHFLNQASYENSSRESCKEIYKLMRQRQDKFCVDFLMIDVMWSELKHSTNELSYLQFLKCIQDMHEQDLLWLDEQGKKVYLI